MKLSSITICGMHKITNATYNLSDMTYFYGRNGAGKSTIMQAIQLGILGYIPGTDKTNAAIFKHANGPVMSVRLVFDNGVEIFRQWMRDSKSVKSTTVTKPEDFAVESILSDRTLPICSFNEFVGMTANKLKDWFIAFLPGSAGSIDWKSELQAVAPTVDIIDKHMLSQAVTSLSGEDTIARLRSFNAECKENISALKADISRIDSTIQSLVYYDDCDSSLDKTDIQTKIQTLKIKHSNVSEKIYKLRSNNKIREKLNQLSLSQYSPTLEDNMEYKDLMTKVQAYTQEIEFLEVEVPKSQAAVASTMEQIRSHERLISGNGICPYTNSTCESISAQIETLKSELHDLEDDLNHQQIYLNSARTKLNDMKDAYNKAKSRISTIKFEYTHYDNLKSQLDESLDESAQADLEAQISEISAEIDKLQDQLVHIAANEKYEKLTKELHNDRMLAEEKLNIYKAWEKLSGVNGFQSKVMLAPFAKFESAMTPVLSAFFCEDVEAKFIVGEKANSFEFGIIRNGTYVEYNGLSSGEKCLFALSFIVTINQQVDSEDIVKMLLIDDLLDHLDSVAIDRTLTTLYNNTGIQIILAGVQHSDIPEFNNFTVRIGE